MASKVNHPSHYNFGRYEVIDVIEDQQLNFNLGNALKYICRAGKKDPDKYGEDLEKAIWYLTRELKNYRKQDKVNKLKEAIKVVDQIKQAEQTGGTTNNDTTD